MDVMGRGQMGRSGQLQSTNTFVYMFRPVSSHKYKQKSIYDALYKYSHLCYQSQRGLKVAKARGSHVASFHLSSVFALSASF